MENARNMNIYIEFQSLDDIGGIISLIKEQNVQIYEVDIDHGRKDKSQNPSAVFSIRLNQKQAHTHVLTTLAELNNICTIYEI